MANTYYLSIEESRKRDTIIIMHILRTFATELKSGWINPESNFATQRYYECWHFINGYYMGSQTCTYYKCLIAEHYLDAICNKYNITI